MKNTYEQLEQLLMTCPIEGSHWRHYKTKRCYKVIGAAIEEDRLIALVVYQPTECPTVSFSRPLHEWEELVEDEEGHSVRRFTRL